MSMGLEGAFGAQGFQQALRQHVMDQLAREQQTFQNENTTRTADRADRALNQQDTEFQLRLKELAEKNQTDQYNKAFTQGEKSAESIAPNTVFPTIDRMAPPSQAPLMGRLQMVGALAPTTGQVGSTTDTQANTRTGTPPTGRLVAMPEGQVKLPTANQQNVIADNARADAALKNTEAHQQEVFGLQSQNAADRLRYQADVLGLQREKFDAAQNKAPKPLTLSAGAKNSRQAIEQAAPMTDQVLAMMEKEFPGIDKQDGTYNTPADKLGSLYQRGKYLLGFNDPNDPRRQIVNLLQPIQAGQYTRSSRSYKMVELALKHMADMSQTPEAQYARAKELRGLMPEMLEGIVRSETPVDPSNPLAGSYFDPSRQSAPDSAPATAPKVEHWARVNGKLVKQ